MKFVTYEIGEDSFKAMRKCLEMSGALGQFIKSQWHPTKKEFEEKNDNVSRLIESLQSLQSLEGFFHEDSIKEASFLGDNVVSLFGTDKKDEPPSN